MAQDNTTCRVYRGASATTYIVIRPTLRSQIHYVVFSTLSKCNKKLDLCLCQQTAANVKSVSFQVLALTVPPIAVCASSVKSRADAYTTVVT